MNIFSTFVTILFVHRPAQAFLGALLQPLNLLIGVHSFHCICPSMKYSQTYKCAIMWKMKPMRHLPHQRFTSQAAPSFKIKRSVNRSHAMIFQTGAVLPQT